MKKTLNLFAAVLILGLMGSAYAACYLQKVILCLGTGDDLGGTFTSGACTTGDTVTTYNGLHAFANQNVYKWDVYSVTRGGFTTADANAGGQNYCSTDANAPDAGSFYAVHYINPCTGGTENNTNPQFGQNPHIVITFPGTVANNSVSQTCN